MITGIWIVPLIFAIWFGLYVVVACIKMLAVFIHKKICGGCLIDEGVMDSGGEVLHRCNKCGWTIWL